MSFTAVGSCPRCGAPIYAPTAGWSVLPPPSQPSCACFPQPRTYTTNGTDVLIEDPTPSHRTIESGVITENRGGKPNVHD